MAAGWGCARSSLGEAELGGQDIRLANSVVEGTGRVDHDVGSSEPFLVGRLSIDPTARVLLGTCPQAHQTIDAHVARGVGHDDEIEWMRDLSLDEQRHVVDHDGARVALARLHDQFGGALTHRRMHDAVQVGQGVSIGEDDRTQRWTVELAIGGDDAIAETHPDRIESRRARLDHLAGEKIGVDVHGPTVFEAPRNG